MREIEKRTFLVLKKCLTAEERKVSVCSVFKEHGIDWNQTAAGDIGDYVTEKKYGTARDYARDDVWITCNTNGEEFVMNNLDWYLANKNSNQLQGQN